MQSGPVADQSRDVTPAVTDESTQKHSSVTVYLAARHRTRLCKSFFASSGTRRPSHGLAMYTQTWTNAAHICIARLFAAPAPPDLAASCRPTSAAAHSRAIDNNRRRQRRSSIALCDSVVGMAEARAGSTEGVWRSPLAAFALASLTRVLPLTAIYFLAGPA